MNVVIVLDLYLLTYILYLDIIFIGIIYAILVKTADEETATEFPAAFVIAFNPIPGPFAVT